MKWLSWMCLRYSAGTLLRTQKLNLKLGWVSGLNLNFKQDWRFLTFKSWYLKAGVSHAEVDTLCIMWLPDFGEGTLITLIIPGEDCMVSDVGSIGQHHTGIVDVNPLQRPVPCSPTLDLVLHWVRHDPLQVPHISCAKEVKKHRTQAPVYQDNHTLYPTVSTRICQIFSKGSNVVTAASDAFNNCELVPQQPKNQPDW